MCNVQLLDIRNAAQTGDLAVHTLKAACGGKLAQPAVGILTGHVVVGVVACHHHQRAQDDLGVTGSLHGLDDGLAGGLLGLAFHRADEHVVVAQALHGGLHLAVAHLGGVGSAVTHKDESGLVGSGSGGAVVTGFLHSGSGNSLGNSFLICIDDGSIRADLAQQGLSHSNTLKLVAVLVQHLVHLVVLCTVHQMGGLQIIINHVQARDGEKIDNMQQALDRAVANGVKNLIVQPTHLMHGAEYDEMMEMIDSYRDKFESVAVAEPLLGEVGSDATVINSDKEVVAKAVTEAAVKDAGYESLDAAAAEKVAFVFMGHGTSHTAKVSYSQMQTTMQTLGYDNVFIGTVEGEPEETACENVIEAVKAAGYTKVVLRPLMVVAGDHANNDMAGADEDSWLSQFNASGAFESVDCQIAGLGEVPSIQELYVAHTKAAIDSLNG